MRTIRLPLPKPAHVVVPRLRSEAEQHGLSWQGDENAGYVTGYGITASYTVAGDELIVQYKKPPFMPVPEKIIRQKLTDLLARV